MPQCFIDQSEGLWRSDDKWNLLCLWTHTGWLCQFLSVWLEYKHSDTCKIPTVLPCEVRAIGWQANWQTLKLPVLIKIVNQNQQWISGGITKWRVIIKTIKEGFILPVHFTCEEEKWVLKNNKGLFETQLGDDHLYLF